MRNYVRTFFLIISIFVIIKPVLSQQDTLSWEYVVSQPWQKSALLDSFAGVHPRLLLDSSLIQVLKGKIDNSHKFIWDIIEQKANGYLNSNPANSPRDEDDTRKDGDAIPWLALAHLMTGDSAYADKAVSWMITVCNYSTWDGNHSLGAGHCLLGVSLSYDWLYNYMTEDQQQTIQDRLSYFANAMSENPQHKERYLSNHCQVEYTGLAAAGLALFDDVTGAEDWARQAYNIFNKAYQIFGNDGSSTEGHQYFGLMTEFQMHFNKLAKGLLGRDFYQESEWLKNMGYFILYSCLPDFKPDNSIMRFGDTRYYNFVSHGPEYQMFNLASEYRNPHFQWLALEMCERNIGTTDRMGWSNLLWYDETIPSSPPDNLNTFRHFDDTGWITSRSNWGQNAVMIGFKCGPFHGHAVQKIYDNLDEYHGLVNGHGHPDVNHFNIYAHGEWLVTDDGYSKPKKTRYHNTILVNGYGQLGEWTQEVNSNWFDRQSVFYAGAQSRIIKAESDSVFDYIVGDAENIYRPEAGLRKYLRHLVYLKPDLIIILDDLQAQEPSKFEWMLHSPGDITKISSNRYRISVGTVMLDAKILLPSSVSVNIGSDQDIDLNFLNLSPQQNTEKSIILVALQPRKISDSQKSVTLAAQSDTIIALEIDDNGRSKLLHIDLKKLQVTLGDVSSVQRISSDRPLDFVLLQNYPNPFNPLTKIEYTNPRANKVSLKVYNICGEEIKTLVDEYQESGQYTVSWDGKDGTGKKVASGIYLYRLHLQKESEIKKMILLH